MALSFGSWLGEKFWTHQAQNGRKERLLSTFPAEYRSRLQTMSFEDLLHQAASAPPAEFSRQYLVLSDPGGAELSLSGGRLGREPIWFSTTSEQELVLSTPWRTARTIIRANAEGGIVNVALSAGPLTWMFRLLGLLGMMCVLGSWRDNVVSAVQAPEEDTEESPKENGELFGHYLRQRLLGSGSMGNVYLAKAPGATNSKSYALKVLHQTWSESEEFRQRFQREITICRRLDDDGIVRVYESGETDGQLWMVMDHVEGRDLSHWLNEQPRCEAEILTMAEALCRGLQHAHDLGVVHRDLKPENILVRTDDRPVIADFGLARGTTDLTITKAHTILGTPAYMSPEQVEGQACDAQSDLYSLGAVLYHCFAGRPPFQGEAMEVIMATLTREPEPLSQSANISSGAEALVHKLLAKDKAKRYRSATEVRQSLLSLK